MGDFDAALAAFRISCEPFNRQRELRDTRPVAVALKHVCRGLATAGPLKGDKARAFFEDNFQPVRIAKLGESTGLITGYYEPIVDGSRIPNPQFHTPLYRRPRDLVIQGQKSGNGAVPNRATVGRLNGKQELEPYHDRLAIEEGALDGQKLEICYVADPFEAMSIQIQGSARVRLEDGTLLRLNYDAHNGHNYTAVGRILIERDLIPREEMTMDRIKRWMQANPDQAKEVRGTNKSFVFFRITGLNNEDEPLGAQGVRLMPGRSIAVDKAHVYGTPFFIEAELPIESARPATPFHRLMVSQDTGSAIVGPARADLYWGAGDDAGKIAGRMRHQGRFVMLLPRELDMIAAGRTMPLPRAKPVIPHEVAAKTSPPKGRARAQSGKSKPGS
jgi:membrane-bound lytic murein transglycosylase A